MYKNKKRTFTPDGENTRNNIAGLNVKKLRLQKQPKWSQKDLADQLQLLGHDVGKNAVQTMESGERFINDIELKVLAKAFEVTVDELLFEEQDSNYSTAPDQSGEKEIAEKSPEYGSDN